MKQVIADRDVVAVAHALDEAASNNALAKMAPPQHRRGLYGRKDRALVRALRLGPNQFVLDSVGRDGTLILGLSHTHSSRQFHLRPDRLPPDVVVILASLPGAGAVRESLRQILEGQHAKRGSG